MSNNRERMPKDFRTSGVSSKTFAKKKSGMKNAIGRIILPPRMTYGRIAVVSEGGFDMMRSVCE
jgi:hypothetical protein